MHVKECKILFSHLKANTLMKMKLTKEQEERCNTMLNSGFERHTKISELQVGTLVTLQGIVTKVRYLF